MLIKPQEMIERAQHSSIHSDGRIMYSFLDNIFVDHNKTRVEP